LPNTCGDPDFFHSRYNNFNEVMGWVQQCKAGAFKDKLAMDMPCTRAGITIPGFRTNGIGPSRTGPPESYWCETADTGK
jgi:hypothetical protein